MIMICMRTEHKNTIEPGHEILNNVVCGTSKVSDQPAHMRSLIRSLASMTVKQLTEHHLVFLSLKGSCTGSSESTLVKMPHCWQSHVTAQFISISGPHFSTIVVHLKKCF